MSEIAACKKLKQMRSLAVDNLFGGLRVNQMLCFQGLEGLEGPVGPQGYDGCNGTKVSSRATVKKE